MSENEISNIIEVDFPGLTRERHQAPHPQNPGRVVGVIAPDEETLNEIITKKGLRPDGPVQKRSLTDQQEPQITKPAKPKPAKTVAVIAPTENSLRRAAKRARLLVPQKKDIEVRLVGKNPPRSILVWKPK